MDQWIQLSDLFHEQLLKIYLYHVLQEIHVGYQVLLQSDNLYMKGVNEEIKLPGNLSK